MSRQVRWKLNVGQITLVLAILDHRFKKVEFNHTAETNIAADARKLHRQRGSPGTGAEHGETQGLRLGPVAAWNDAFWDAESGIVTYETHYRIAADKRELSASSRIRFTSQKELARLIEPAGLTVESWLGNWQGEAYAPSSPEIIPLGRRH